MKRIAIGMMCLLMVTATVLPVSGQGRRERYYRGGEYNRRYETPRYYGDGHYDGRYRRNDRRSWWDRHRDKTTVAIGAGTGAVIGGAAGGGRGAAIGALVGAGASALYTYRLRDRNDRRYYGRSRGRYYR